MGQSSKGPDQTDGKCRISVATDGDTMRNISVSLRTSCQSPAHHVSTLQGKMKGFDDVTTGEAHPRTSPPSRHTETPPPHPLINCQSDPISPLRLDGCTTASPFTGCHEEAQPSIDWQPAGPFSAMHNGDRARGPSLHELSWSALWPLRVHQVTVDGTRHE